MVVQRDEALGSGHVGLLEVALGNTEYAISRILIDYGNYSSEATCCVYTVADGCFFFCRRELEG